MISLWGETGHPPFSKSGFAHWHPGKRHGAVTWGVGCLGDRYVRYFKSVFVRLAVDIRRNEDHASIKYVMACEKSANQVKIYVCIIGGVECFS